MSLTVLVTGATGFLGSHLVKAFLSQGYQVIILKRSFSSTEKIDDVLSQCAVYDLDLCELDEPFKDFQKIDVVVHTATCYGKKSELIDDIVSTNVTFPVGLLENMVEHGVKKIINTGTYWQHHLNAAYNPVSLYAATKQAFEDILLYYVDSKQIDAITLKLFDIYGQGDTRRKVVNLLLDAAINETPLKLSPGEQKLSLVHVDDVVSAYEIALNLLTHRSGYQHSCYGIAHSEVYSLKQIADLVEQVTGKKLKTEWGALPYRDREVMEPWTNFKSLPGWQPQISLQQGLAQLT